MSDKIERLKKLESAELSKNTKHVKVDGLSDLVQEVKNIAASAEKSRRECIAVIKELGKIIAENKPQSEAKEIISAIQKLEFKIAPEAEVPTNYKIEFDRDRNGLMKSGIMLISVPPEKHH